MQKTVTSCNWVPSIVTENTLKDFVKVSFLPAKDILHWRAPNPGEDRPQPKDGEVIVFTDHMHRGFSPPGSKFFRDVLHFFQLHPQDIGPNSVSNICNFQVFCKVYLQEEPSVELFREYFYLNRQNEFTNGPNLELGTISIQRRRDAIFLMLACRVTPRIGTRRGFIARIPLRLTRIHCRVIILNVLTWTITFQKSSQVLNVKKMLPQLRRARLCWEAD